MKSIGKRSIWRKLIIAVIWLGIWQLIATAVSQEILIVSPAVAALRLIELMGTASFWGAVGMSVLRIFCGFAAAAAVGALLGAITAFVPLLDDFFRPVLSIVRATPVASFIILAFVWMATGLVPVFIAFLMVLPIVWGNVGAGLKSADPKLLEMARAFGVSRARQIRRIYIPSAMPYFVASLTTGLGLAWKAGIAAEVICVPGMSIGKLLYSAKIYLETPDLFAVTAAVIIISVIMEKLMVRVLKGFGRKWNAQ